jgi:hypothetical protein
MSQEYRNSGFPAIGRNTCGGSIVFTLLRKFGFPADGISEQSENWIAKNENAGTRVMKSGSIKIDNAKSASIKSGAVALETMPRTGSRPQ